MSLHVTSKATHILKRRNIFECPSLNWNKRQLLSRNSRAPAQKVRQPSKYPTFLVEGKLVFSEICLCSPPVFLRGVMVMFPLFGTLLLLSACAAVVRAVSSEEGGF